MIQTRLVLHRFAMPYIIMCQGLKKVLYHLSLERYW